MDLLLAFGTVGHANSSFDSTKHPEGNHHSSHYLGRQATQRLDVVVSIHIDRKELPIKVLKHGDDQYNKGCHHDYNGDPLQNV